MDDKLFFTIEVIKAIAFLLTLIGAFFYFKADGSRDQESFLMNIKIAKIFIIIAIFLHLIGWGAIISQSL